MKSFVDAPFPSVFSASKQVNPGISKLDAEPATPFGKVNGKALGNLVPIGRKQHVLGRSLHLWKQMDPQFVGKEGESGVRR